MGKKNSMKQHGVVLTIGMMLLLGIVGLGCDEKTEKIKEQERQIEEKKDRLRSKKDRLRSKKNRSRIKGKG